MKALISKKNINDYSFNNELAGKYIFALQQLHSGGTIPFEIQMELKRAGLYSNDKLRVFNYKKEKKKKPAVIGNEPAYDKKSFIAGMVSSNSPVHKIIGLYLLLTDTYMPSIEIANSVVARHLRDATALKPWLETPESKALLKNTMVEVSKHAKENDYNFNLNTIYKRLTT